MLNQSLKPQAKAPPVLYWTCREGREANCSDEASPLNALNQILWDFHKHGSIFSTTVHTCSPPGATRETIACSEACGGGSFEWPWGHLGDNRAHSHNFSPHPGFEAEGTAVCWTQVSGWKCTAQCAGVGSVAAVRKAKRMVAQLQKVIKMLVLCRVLR